MANHVAQLLTIKNSCDHLIISGYGLSEIDEKHCIFFHMLRKCSKFGNACEIWFRVPHPTIVLLTCEDLDGFKTILNPCLKLIVQNEEREWFIIVFVSSAHPSSDQATKVAKKVYAKLKVDFSSRERERERERCGEFDLHYPEPSFWEDLESKIVNCVRNTLDRRVQFYEDENLVK